MFHIDLGHIRTLTGHGTRMRATSLCSEDDFAFVEMGGWKVIQTRILICPQVAEFVLVAADVSRL